MNCSDETLDNFQNNLSALPHAVRVVMHHYTTNDARHSYFWIILDIIEIFLLRERERERETRHIANRMVSERTTSNMSPVHR